VGVGEGGGGQRPVLVGANEGGRSVAVLAATRPELAGGLIAFAPNVRGIAANRPEIVDMALKSLDALEYASLASMVVPGWAEDPVRHDRVERYFQTCVTPRQSERVLRMMLSSDVGGALPLVQTPTLAVYPRDLKVVTLESVQEFVGLIPGAEYREIQGNTHFLFALDVALVAGVIEEFVTGTTPTPLTDRVLATLVFTDLVDSTGHAARAGDRSWAETIDRHLAESRVAVGDHGGELI